MKIYVSISSFIDTVATDKLVNFDFNSIPFQSVVRDRSGKRFLRGFIDPVLDLGLPNAEDLTIEIQYHSDNYHPLSSHNENHICMHFNSLQDKTKGDILTTLIHELKHYYDKHYNRGLLERAFYDNSGREKRPEDYYFHDVELIPQAYSLAIATIDIPELKLIEIFKAIVKSKNTYKMDDALVKIGREQGQIYDEDIYTITKSGYSFLRFVSNKIKTYIDSIYGNKHEDIINFDGDVIGHPQAALPEDAHKRVKRVKVFFKYILSVRRKLERHFMDVDLNTPFSPKVKKRKQK